MRKHTCKVFNWVKTHYIVSSIFGLLWLIANLALYYYCTLDTSSLIWAVATISVLTVIIFKILECHSRHKVFWAFIIWLGITITLVVGYSCIISVDSSLINGLSLIAAASIIKLTSFGFIYGHLFGWLASKDWDHDKDLDFRIRASKVVSYVTLLVMGLLVLKLGIHLYLITQYKDFVPPASFVVNFFDIHTPSDIDKKSHELWGVQFFTYWNIITLIPVLTLAAVNGWSMRRVTANPKNKDQSYRDSYKFLFLADVPCIAAAVTMLVLTHIAGGILPPSQASSALYGAMSFFVFSVFISEELLKNKIVLENVGFTVATTCPGSGSEAAAQVTGAPQGGVQGS